MRHQINLNPLIGSMVAVIVMIVTSCGNDTEFQGNSAPKNLDAIVEPPAPTPPPPPPPPPPRRAEQVAVNWNWDCVAPVAFEESDESEEVSIKGSGTHKISTNENEVYDIQIEGGHCTQDTVDLDLLFIVDVSGSMFDNDPINGGGCGRFDAVNTILDELPSSNRARVGIIAFNQKNLFSSIKLAAIDEVRDAGLLDTRVLCESGGGTNYKVALTEAISMMQDAREGSSREIYFISDGDPEKGKDGLEEANILKDLEGINARILTLMLKGDDKKLKALASRDAYGKPLHRITDDADELAEKLAELAGVEFVAAELRYRAIGEEKWEVVSLSDPDSALDYSALVSEFSPERYPNGAEFMITYTDRSGAEHSRISKIIFE